MILRDTRAHGKAEALNDTLPDTTLQEKAEPVGDTMANVTAKPSTRLPKPYKRQRPKQTLKHYAM